MYITYSSTYHVLALISSTFHEKIFISPIIYFFHEKVKILLVVANKKKFFCLLEFEYHSMEKLHCTIKLLFFLFIYTYEQLIFICELLHIDLTKNLQLKKCLIKFSSIEIFEIDDDDVLNLTVTFLLFPRRCFNIEFNI